MRNLLSFLVHLGLIGFAVSQYDPHFVADRTSMVHLFEWRWDDIAAECERFLGPYGYGGVQVSPPNENVIVHNSNNQRPWWERYQPVSYKLETRSGTEEQFKSMVRRCSNVGVRIYIDFVGNHMVGAGQVGVGTGGTPYNGNSLDFPGVPYSALDFNPACDIRDYNNPIEVRNCRLVGLTDLNQGLPYVRERLIDFINKLSSYGVAGMRIDAQKHMWPGDWNIMVGGLNNLPTDFGFPANSKPFIFQEVIDLGGEGIKASEYVHLGRVTEFKFGAELGRVFRKKVNLKELVNFGEGWGMLKDAHAFVFVDNHDNQRGHGAGGADILTFRTSRMYKMAQAFTMAWPYGVTRVMSSFFWEQDWQDGQDKNDWVGPPHDGNYNTLPVTINPDMTCGNGWICEHRWRQIYNMVKFRNVVRGTGMNDWWDNGRNQIAFCRGDRGFLAINNDDHPLNNVFQTCLSVGSYCDVISGNLEDGRCTGKVIVVDNGGMAAISISHNEEDPMVAIHAQSKL